MRIGSGGSTRPTMSKAAASGAFQTQKRSVTPYVSAAAPVRSYATPAPVKRAPAPAPARQAYVQRQVNSAPRQNTQAPVRRAPAPAPRPNPAPRPSAPAAPAPRAQNNLNTRNGTVTEVAQRLAAAKASAAIASSDPQNTDTMGRVQQQPFLGGSAPTMGNPNMGMPELAPAGMPTPGTDPNAGAQPTDTAPIDPTGGQPVALDPAAPPPSEEDWLTGDTTYQDQQAQLRRDFAAYQSTQQLDSSNYDQSYQGQLRDMTKNQQDDTVGLNDDFASRGLTNSGLYAKAQADLGNKYDTQRAGVESAKTQYLSQLQQQLADYQNQQASTALTGKQDSIGRRSSMYGLAGA